MSEFGSNYQLFTDFDLLKTEDELNDYDLIPPYSDSEMIYNSSVYKDEIRSYEEYPIISDDNGNVFFTQECGFDGENEYSCPSPANSTDSGNLSTNSESEVSEVSEVKVRYKRVRKRKRHEVEKDNERFFYLKKKKNKSKKEKAELIKLRNRWSAQKSRDKKKAAMQVKDNMINDLNNEIEELKRQNKELRERLNNFKSYDEEEDEELPINPKKRRKTGINKVAYVFSVLLFGLVFFGIGANYNYNSRSVSPSSRQILGTEKNVDASSSISNEILNYSYQPSFVADDRLMFDPKDNEMIVEKVVIPDELKFHFIDQHGDDKGVVSVNQDDFSDEYGYIYKKKDDTSKVYLFCPFIYALLSDSKSFIGNGENEELPEIVVVYPTEVYNTTSNESVYGLTEIEVSKEKFSEDSLYFSFSKPVGM